MSSQVWVWIAFNVFVLMMLAVDLGVLHRRSHAVTLKEAKRIGQAAKVAVQVSIGVPAAAAKAAQMLAEIDKAREERAAWMVFYEVDPRLDGLRSPAS